MKATELMIGDLILYQKHSKIFDEIGVVSALHNRSRYLCVTDIYGNNPISLRYESDIEPIPLTAEILKANGFELIDKGDYGEWKIKENPNIPFWECNGFTIFGGIEIKYVHQLQHALRLCGLNELADNFKLK